jgi:hypothetical protein
MRKRLIPAALLGAALVGTSALADPIDVGELVSKSYYLAQDPTTNRCIVVDIKPTPIGVPSLAYESRALAERAIAQANAYDVMDCIAPVMSADGRDDKQVATVTARDSGSEQRDSASTPKVVAGAGKQ